MVSDVITVSSRGSDRTAEVLAQAERVAAYQNLPPKSALHLRLLAEEMMGMVRAIAGNLHGEFWIENDGPQYELHLLAETDMDFEKREKLIATSTKGINEAERGLMGKIRAFFEPIEGTPVYFDTAVSTSPQEIGWSMNTYQKQLEQMVSEKREGAAEAWDELEKSVIAHVADEVRISIHGYDVEMIVFKKF